MVTRLVKFPGCCQYLKVPAGQLSRLITNGKVLKKLVVLDGPILLRHRFGLYQNYRDRLKLKNRLESALKNRFKKQWKCAVSGRPPFSANT
jgi:hypothetical protein